MIGIDTSVLLRNRLKDDPTLSPRALEIIAGNDCFVTRAALTEVVYTLESYYRSARVDIGPRARHLAQRSAYHNRGPRRDRAGGVLVQGRNGFRRCDDCRFVA